MEFSLPKATIGGPGNVYGMGLTFLIFNQLRYSVNIYLLKFTIFKLSLYKAQIAHNWYLPKW